MALSIRREGTPIQPAAPQPEPLTIPELGWEIEALEYRLHILAEDAPEKRRVFALREGLRLLLRQRVEEALEVEADAPGTPPEERNGDIPVWVGSEQLERPEDIVACWYLYDDFPLITDQKKMQQIETELLRQQSALEAEEPAAAENGTLDLWRYRREQRMEQLEQIRSIWLHAIQTEESWQEEWVEEEWPEEELTEEALPEELIEEKLTEEALSEEEPTGEE